MKTPLRAVACLCLLLALPMLHAQDTPEVVALNQRLVAIDADPALNSLASLERMQARQAVQALAATRSRSPGATPRSRARRSLIKLTTRSSCPAMCPTSAARRCAPSRMTPSPAARRWA